MICNKLTICHNLYLSYDKYLVEVSNTIKKIFQLSNCRSQKCVSRFETLMNQLRNLDIKEY